METTTQPVTMATVADVAKVSKATVSAVLNNKPNVSPSTRRHVAEVMRKLGYGPSAASAGGGNGGVLSSMIGLVVKEITNPYFGEIIRTAHQTADELGYHLVVSTSEGSIEKEGEAVEQLTRRGAAGVIVSPVLSDASDFRYLYEAQRRNLPVVVLGSAPGVRVPSVSIDNIEASRLAVAHLLELGHERFVHFSGPSYAWHARERVLGVQQAFSETTLAFDPECVHQAGASIEDGYGAASAWLEEEGELETPVAISCYNDLVALGVWEALRERGYEVPRDASIVGIDNLAFLNRVPLPLTSVAIEGENIGARVVRLLADQIADSDSEVSQRIVLKSKLVTRGSTSHVSASAEPIVEAAPERATARGAHASASST
jgi:LacI family transcriptional regulator/LacI family repressor for deo operon, udp, cdd, tsx, nupC, and nupG